MEGVWSVELKKWRTSPVFLQRKVLLKKFCKCKLYLKNSVKLIKKNKFAATQLKISLVTHISGKKSVSLFNLTERKTESKIQTINLLLKVS